MPIPLALHRQLRTLMPVPPSGVSPWGIKPAALFASPPGTRVHQMCSLPVARGLRRGASDCTSLRCKTAKFLPHTTSGSTRECGMCIPSKTCPKTCPRRSGEHPKVPPASQDGPLKPLDNIANTLNSFAYLLTGSQEVGGSNPPSSTNGNAGLRSSIATPFCLGCTWVAFGCARIESSRPSASLFACGAQTERTGSRRQFQPVFVMQATQDRSRHDAGIGRQPMPDEGGGGQPRRGMRNPRPQARVWAAVIVMGPPDF
jgi:hypothetical protein